MGGVRDNHKTSSLLEGEEVGRGPSAGQQPSVSLLRHQIQSFWWQAHTTHLTSGHNLASARPPLHLGFYCGPTVCVQCVCMQCVCMCVCVLAMTLCELSGSGACWVGLFCFAGVPAGLAFSQNLACSVPIPRCPCRQDGGEWAGCQGRQVAS